MVRTDIAALELSDPAFGDVGAVPVSALRGWGIDALRRRIAFEVLGEPVETAAP